MMAEGLGIEPRIAESKSAVIPFNYPPTNLSVRMELYPRRLSAFRVPTPLGPPCLFSFCRNSRVIALTLPQFNCANQTRSIWRSQGESNPSLHSDSVES